MALTSLRMVDVDSHLTEPADLWRTRLSASRWGDAIPTVVHNDRLGEDRWVVAGRRLPGVGTYSFAGWRDFPPAHPPTFAEIMPAAFDSAARVSLLDDYGIAAQALFPNILGFHSNVFFEYDPAFATACVRAYNDYLTEFCSSAPNRFIALTMLPFWDVQASIEEMRRTNELGHRGVIFGVDFSTVGLPPLMDPHWDPLLATAQELAMPVNLHIGFAATAAADFETLQRMKSKADYVKETALFMCGNARAVADILTSGICDRFPDLCWVSIESGAGWLPYFLESLDWQWMNSGAYRDLPQRLLPSEYFRRQVYGSFWFEEATLTRALELYPDNLMFETDFPHPTSLTPGPASHAESPPEAAQRRLGGLSAEIQAKALHDTAARLYRLADVTP